MYKILFLILISTNLFGSQKWDFKFEHILKYNKNQIEVLKYSYIIGSQKDLELTLTAIAIVETRAGLFKSKNNKYCGPHQISMETALKREPSSDLYLCEAVRDNAYLSAYMALEELSYWFSLKKSWRQSIKHYNGGWNTSKHGEEYLRRFMLVYNELKANKRYLINIII